MAEQKTGFKILDTSNWGTSIIIIAYAFGMIWWAATINAKVVQNEKWIEANKNMPTIIAQFETKFESLGEKIDNLAHQFEKYNAKMDKYLMYNGKR